MRKLVRVTASLFAALATITVLATSAFPKEADFDQMVEAFSGLPMISDPALSPTGRWVAVRQALRGQYTVVVYDLESNEEPFAWELPADTVLLDFKWVAEDRILVELLEPFVYFYVDFNPRRRRNEQFSVHTYDGSRIHVQVIDPDGDNYLSLYSAASATPFIPGTTQIIDPMWDDPDHILMSPISTGRHPLQRVNIRVTERARDVNDGNDHTQSWLVDREGNVRLRVDAEEGELRIYARDRPRSRWRRILRSRPMEEWSFLPLSFAQDGRHIYVNSNHEDRSGLYRLDLRDPDEMERVFLHESVDAGGAFFDGSTGEPLAIGYTEDVPRLHFVDDEFERLNRRLANSLPGPEVHIVDSAALAPVHVVLSTGPSTPPVFYILNEEEGTLRLIEAAFPALDGVPIGRVEAVSYASRDGVMIDGYLTYPPEHAGSALPMVVMPHGGPHARDTMEFDTLPHLIASRGYVVFQMNFRGSTGYGFSFLQAGYREWGGVMQNDLSDGIDAMIARGVARPDQICLLGISYGGYAVMLEAMRRPELFRCVAAVAGVYDLPAFLESPNGTLGASFWNVSLGTLEDDREALEAQSPQHLVRDGLPPVFLAHGEHDYVVPVEQTRNMSRALVDGGHNVAERYYVNSDHYFDYEPDRIELYNQLLIFLDRYMED